MAPPTNLSTMPTLSSLLSLSSRIPRYVPTILFYSPCKPSLTLTSPPSISSKPTIHNFKTQRLRSLIVASSVKTLSETDPLPVSPENDDKAGNLPSDSGVYAVYDKSNELQFIGITRNIAASISTHRKSLPELCYSVKIGVVEPEKAALTQAWKSWMEEYIKIHGKVPPGNESGNITWVRPRPKTKADLRLTPGRHVQLTVPLQELIDKLVKENKVVAFIKGSRSAPLCGFSQRVIGILEGEGVDYESVDVLDDEYNFGLRETLKKYSNWPTFPQIFVNGELVGGCDILSSMHEKGELAGLFKK